MKSEVRVPALPESVADATVLTWHKRPGEPVRREETLVDLETDKVVLEVPAPTDGVLGAWLFPEGASVPADAVLAEIEVGAPVAAGAGVGTAPAPAPAPTSAPASASASAPRGAEPTPAPDEPLLAPAARRLVKELALDPSAIPGSGRDGRIHKADVMHWLDRREADGPARDPELTGPTPVRPDQPAAAEDALLAAVAPVLPALTGEAGRPEQRVPMTRLRARIAERLVDAQRNAAMLTTFNEVDMSAVTALRHQYRERFEQTHGVRLGLTSFFVKGAVEALQRFPVLNASVDGHDIVYHGFYDIGIAVSSPRGLVVPILRNCDQLTMADIEQGITDFATKAKDGTLSFEELTGGTFSITNGGVFGSLLSTPILNPPQSAILGLHAVQQRPVAVQGTVVIRPMMYLALTYDHRIVDGREAVQFLVTVKETLEDPARLLLRV